MEKQRILQICTTPLQYDGLSRVVFALCENADFEKYEIDVLLTLGGKPELLDKLSKDGINVITRAKRDGGVPAYIKSLLALMREKEYDVVHVHGNSATMAIEMFAAKSAGIGVRIAHGHNTKTNHPVVHKILQPFLNSWCNRPVACGKLAGKFLFGKKDVFVIPNSVDTDRFSYNEEKRQKTRTLLEVSNELLIGHIGRFSYQKNHEFLLEIFAKVLKLRKNSKLVLVGEGELLPQIRDKVESLRISDRVIFYGTTDDTSSLYSAFDAFLLPSRFEGLSITAIEAQANGLCVITSDATTDETDITGNCKFLSLDEDVKVWAKTVLDNITPLAERKTAANLVKNAGYDILSFGKIIDKIWL